jgi:GNAT superfamily N-acetyltransferase
MEILPISRSTISEAAVLFASNYRDQLKATPELPGEMAESDFVEKKLGSTFDASSSLVAVENGEVCGFLSWFLVDNFRGSGRKAAYMPEWGHACVESGKTKIYQALYRHAAVIWSSAGCVVHAITILAQDKTAEKTWFWNGFGLTVVDAIRPMQPLSIPYSTGVTIRPVTPQDVPALTKLDAEHCQHYSQSPIFMPKMTPRSEAENLAFIARPKNSVWVAEDGKKLAGFLRFEGYDFDSVAIVESGAGILINGAYVLPEYRGRKIAVAILDAALRDYQSRGFIYCTVNFETFNPEASTFWVKYFDPVCLSVVRVPET